MNSNYYLPCPRAGMFLEQWAITWNSDGRINFSENCKILSWNHEWHLFFNEFLYVPVTDVITYHTKKTFFPLFIMRLNLASHHDLPRTLSLRLERRHEYWDHIDGIGAIVRPPSSTVEAISILWSQIRQKGAKFWIETLIASKERLK